MPRYFFDTRTEDALVRDEEGLVLDGLDEARAEPTEALADMARDAIRKEGTITVEVREESGGYVLKASAWSEVQVLES